MAYARIRPRRGTQYEWSSYDPVLAEGELAIQFPDTGIGTGLCKFKVGDGVTSWNQLPYAFDGTAAAAIDGGGIVANSLIQIRTATANAWYNTNPILVEKEIAYCSDANINSIKIGDGNTRWNGLPYIKASGLIENASNYDFGSEDEGDEETPIDEMEDYVSYNSNFEPSVWDNYGVDTPDLPEPDPDEPVEPDPDEPTPYPVEPDQEEPSEDPDNTEEPVESAGIRDILDLDGGEPVRSAKVSTDAEDKPEAEETPEVVEDVVEEAPVKKSSRKSKK